MWQPSSLDQMVNIEKPREKLNEWMNIYQQTLGKSIAPPQNFPRAIYLTGPPGLGKTTLARLFLKSFSYDFIEYNTTDIRTEKLLTYELNTTFQLKYSLVTHHPLSFIIDEIDAFTPEAIKSLLNFLQTALWLPPIFLISNQTIDGLGQLLNIALTQPQPIHTHQLVQTLAAELALPHLTLQASLALAQLAQSDFRRLQQILLATRALVRATPNPPQQLDETHIKYISTLIINKIIQPTITTLSLQEAINLPLYSNLPPYYDQLMRNKLPGAIHEHYPGLISALKLTTLAPYIQMINNISHADLIAPSPLQTKMNIPPSTYYPLQAITFAFPTLSPPPTIILPLDGRSAYSDHSHHRKYLKQTRRLDHTMAYPDFTTPQNLQLMALILQTLPIEAMAEFSQKYSFDLDNLDSIIKSNKLIQPLTRTQSSNLKKQTAAASKLIVKPSEPPLIAVKGKKRGAKPKFILQPKK